MPEGLKGQGETGGREKGERKEKRAWEMEGAPGKTP